MANIFTDFWYRINKKLVPRNSKVTETSSDFIVELQNANEDEPADRETLVSFSIPKGTSFTSQDRAQVDAALTAFENVKTVTPGQWTAIQNLSALETRVTTAETNIDNLENRTDATVTANQATTTIPGYMTTAQVEHLNATVTVPATSTIAGYMSAADKAALDTLKQYSQRYALIYATENSTQPDEYATIVLQTGTKTAGDQYGFKFNNVTFNKSIATIQEDQTRIRINQSGVYLILATGCIVPQLRDGVTRQSNCFTMRIIHGKSTDSISLAVDGGKVTGGRSIASSNVYFYENWYTSGTTFTVAKLEEGDMLSLVAAIPVAARTQMAHYNSRIFLFNALSTQQSEFIPEDPVKPVPDADASGNDDNTQQEG